MVRKVFFILSAICLMCVAGCSGDGKKEGDGESQNGVKPLNEVLNIHEVRGVVGDGTSMNVVEVVTDGGDTVYVTTPVRMVAGGVRVGDVVDMIYTEGEYDNVGSVAVNISALSHVWNHVDSRGHEQSIEFCENGVVNTWNMSVGYNSWSLEGGVLLLHTPAQIAREIPAMVDSFLIMNLNEKELVLSSHGIETVFER